MSRANAAALPTPLSTESGRACDDTYFYCFHFFNFALARCARLLPSTSLERGPIVSRKRSSSTSCVDRSYRASLPALCTTVSSMLGSVARCSWARSPTVLRPRPEVALNLTFLGNAEAFQTLHRIDNNLPA